MKNKVFRLVLVVSLFGLIAACSMQPVKEAGSVSHNMALVKGLSSWNPLSVIAVTITRIDDKNFSKAGSHEVAPGKHKIEVRCSREKPESSQRYFVFEMYLKAGHQYKPRLDMTKECHVNYIDKESGKIYMGTEK